MKNAITKAIEGGWNNPALLTEPIVLHRKFGVETATRMVHTYITSDPLFWQALGKAMGWGKVKETHVTDGKGGFVLVYIPSWHYQWLRFIDHLAEGKDAESFFNNLLT